MIIHVFHNMIAQVLMITYGSNKMKTQENVLINNYVKKYNHNINYKLMVQRDTVWINVYKKYGNIN